MKKKIIGAIIAIVVIALCICTIAIPTTGNDNPLSTTISEDYIPSETTLPTEAEEETSVTDATETQSVEESEIIETQIQEIVTEQPTEPAIIPTKPPVTETTEPEATEPSVTETTEPEVIEPPSESETTESEDIWAIRAAEYPVATQVWLYMRDTLGWNEYVCAGVMGNIMAECGGQTLNLNPSSKNKSSGCYGLCQWHPKYFPNIQGASLDAQLEFLGTSTKDTFDGWAGNVFNCSYDEFIALTDYEVAARKFNDIYERPGSYSSQRNRNAKVAYEYFTS